MLPRPSTTISLRFASSPLRSTWSTSEPSGSWRSSRPSGPETTTSRPSGSQSIENGMVVGTVAITSALPSRSTARISCAPQLDSHSRPSCQRADSAIFNPVNRTSVIVVTPQQRREPLSPPTGTATARIDTRAVALEMTHETPGDLLVRALPSPYRARAVVSPGVSCRGARSHGGLGASTGAEAGLWMMLGTSRAWVLTGAGALWTTGCLAGDNRVKEKNSLLSRPGLEAARVLWTGKSCGRGVATRCDTPGDERVEGT